MSPFCLYVTHFFLDKGPPSLPLPGVYGAGRLQLHALSHPYIEDRNYAEIDSSGLAQGSGGVNRRLATAMMHDADLLLDEEWYGSFYVACSF